MVSLVGSTPPLLRPTRPDDNFIEVDGQKIFWQYVDDLPSEFSTPTHSGTEISDKWTWISKGFIVKEAIVYLDHYFEETPTSFYILGSLHRSVIDHLIRLSHRSRQSSRASSKLIDAEDLGIGRNVLSSKYDYEYAFLADKYARKESPSRFLFVGLNEFAFLAGRDLPGACSACAIKFVDIESAAKAKAQLATLFIDGRQLRVNFKHKYDGESQGAGRIFAREVIQDKENQNNSEYEEVTSAQIRRDNLASIPAENPTTLRKLSHPKTQRRYQMNLERRLKELESKLSSISEGHSTVADDNELLKYKQQHLAIQTEDLSAESALDNGYDYITGGTRIKLNLVSPIALEFAQEPYSIEDEYAIVRRALTRSEIESYADFTKSVKEAQGGNSPKHDEPAKDATAAKSIPSKRMDVDIFYHRRAPAWICVDSIPGRRNCTDCIQHKTYMTVYDAVSHVRYSHFATLDIQKAAELGWPQIEELEEFLVKEVSQPDQSSNVLDANTDTVAPPSSPQPSHPYAMFGKVEQGVRKFWNGRSNLEPCIADVSVRWEFFEYITQELDDNYADFENAIVITGSTDSAIACTIMEYISSIWPVDGIKLITAIKDMAAQRSPNPTHTIKSLPLPYGYLLLEDDQRISLHFEGHLEQLCQACQIFCWLSAVCRVPKTGPLACSIVEFTASEGLDYLLIRLLPFEPVSKGSLSCWHPLFDNMPLAQGFPIPAPRVPLFGGIGLTFELMATLAGISYPLDFEDGTIFKGPSTILIPTAVDEDTCQWHLLTSGDRSELLSAASASDFCNVNGWFATKDYMSLMGRKAYLGYSPQVAIHLGTEGPAYNEIGVTDALPEKSSLRVSELSPQIGASVLNMVNFQISGKIRLTRGLRASMWSLSLADNERLALSKRNPLILYDTTIHRGWMVSEASILLHMIHTWASTQKDHVQASQIPFAKPTADAGQEAESVLLDSASRILRTNVDGSAFRIHDKLRQYIDVLDRLKETVESSNANATTFFNFPGREGLLGFEFLDIVNHSPYAVRKKISLPNSSGRWSKLMASNPEILVLIGTNFGNVIRPVTTTSLCQNWTATDEKDNQLAMKGYLAASVRCLVNLSKNKYGVLQPPLKVAEKLYWGNPWRESPFMDCGGSLNKCPLRIQTLSRNIDKAKALGAEDLKHGQDGAVIFGEVDQESKKRTCRHPCQNTGSQIFNPSIFDSVLLSAEKVPEGGLEDSLRDEDSIDWQSCLGSQPQLIPPRRIFATSDLKTPNFFSHTISSRSKINEKRLADHALAEAFEVSM